jgi:hypothetical protein
MLMERCLILFVVLFCKKMGSVLNANTSELSTENDKAKWGSALLSELREDKR